ncbi:flagellar biosynthetic protein FliO [Pelagibius sp. CAU 1746]|uniref:FliO/MopB family protein n=1 Tax=Pelagibius sp. CAU 1746 TaxID=3140370 RepID=UPI00325B9072
MDLGEYFRFFLALAFVLVLIAGLAALLRRSGFGERLAATPSSAGPRRLSLVEVRPLDAKHKLILVRRDDREHLVLLGATSDLLIESDIPAPPVRPAAAASPVQPGGSADTVGTQNLVTRLAGKLRRQTP